jgi:co-chaperonin GroES (HSP10)
MSKDYVKIFQELDPDESLFLLYGEYILVNVLQDKEEDLKSAGGIILAPQSNQRIGGLNSERPVFAEVLLVGEGFTDSEGKNVAPAAEPGDIVVIGQNSPLIFSRFGTVPTGNGFNIALIKEENIIMQFPSRDAYETYFNNLKKALRGDQP